ncbi:hypothetical protein ACFVAV_11300 [Nocardia sp. NPDC057663]|uniref:hypothetical protein n=1 Tax=Nocardia sp. NPDC057663 TaxID=3346201 RepID=UPI00366C5CF9
MPTERSQAARPEATTRDDVGADRAHVFFWSELCIAAAVSVVGNATQAVLHTTVLPAVVAAVAVIPPLALLAAVHGVALLARANTVSPREHPPRRRTHSAAWSKSFAAPSSAMLQGHGSSAPQ